MHDWHERQRTSYIAAFERGEHDRECEQRERFFICHCDLRKRQKEGPSEPPTLWFSNPTCSHCHEEVSHDGDGFVCTRCHCSWRGNAGEEEPATFDDDYGQLYRTAAGEEYDPEVHGRRLRHIAIERIHEGSGA